MGNRTQGKPMRFGLTPNKPITHTGRVNEHWAHKVNNLTKKQTKNTQKKKKKEILNDTRSHEPRLTDPGSFILWRLKNIWLEQQDSLITEPWSVTMKDPSFVTWHVIREPLLHALVLTSGYLRHCCLLFTSASLAILLWPQRTATRYFFFFKAISINHGDGCVVQSL